MRIALSMIVLAAHLGFAGSVALAEPLVIDKSHTSVGFTVRHLFTRVAGRFDTFEGKIAFDPQNPGSAKVEGAIDAASINTNNEKRDTHLRSEDFFAVEKYPKILFKSTKVSDVDATRQTGKLHGVLKIRGVERPVVLDVAFLGTGKDPWGNSKAGFTASGTINRKDFGLNWNEALETGGFLVGDDVEIEINAEANVPE